MVRVAYSYFVSSGALWLSCFLKSIFYYKCPIRFSYTSFKNSTILSFSVSYYTLFHVLQYFLCLCSMPVYHLKWRALVQIICGLWFVGLWPICIDGLPLLTWNSNLCSMWSRFLRFLHIYTHGLPFCSLWFMLYRYGRLDDYWLV